MATLLGSAWGDWCVNSWHFRSGLEVYETSREPQYVYYALYGYAHSTQTVMSYGKSVLEYSTDSGSTWYNLTNVYPVSLPYGQTITGSSTNTWFTRVSSGTRSILMQHWFSSPDSSTSGYSTGSRAQVWITVPCLEYHTVSYNANGGTGAPGSQTKWYGSILTLSSTKPSRTGYTFQGWATSASGSVAYQPGGSYGADSDVTLYAIWKQITYTIAYNANGGLTSSIPASQTKVYGTNVTLSSAKPTYSGNDFQGWATSASGSVAYQPGATYSANASVTLYAVWKKKTYTIAFNANGGSGSIASVTKTYGVNLTLPKNTTITKTNYLFQGWGKTAQDTTSAWSDGGTYADNAAATLYAIWKQNVISCTVAFNANGGSGAPASITHWSKSYSTLPSVTPTKTNCSFLGWAASSTATARKWVSGGLYYNDSFSAGATITLYAVWAQNATWQPRFSLGEGQTIKSVRLNLPSGSTAVKDVHFAVPDSLLQTSDGNLVTTSDNNYLSVKYQ